MSSSKGLPSRAYSIPTDRGSLPWNPACRGLHERRSYPPDPNSVARILPRSLLYNTKLRRCPLRKACHRGHIRFGPIKTAFHDRCFDKQTNKWRNIELLNCTPISDEALTYAMSLKLKRWNADYISLRAEPAQLMITE